MITDTTKSESFDKLRTNGNPFEIVGVESLNADPVEAFFGFFRRIITAVALRRSTGLAALIAFLLVAAAHLEAQTAARRARVSIPGANVTYLPF